MNKAQVNQTNKIQQQMAEEEKIRQRFDRDGTKRMKVNFGGGYNFRNWLSQFEELKGEDNVKVEETDSKGLSML